MIVGGNGSVIDGVLGDEHARGGRDAALQRQIDTVSFAEETGARTEHDRVDLQRVAVHESCGVQRPDQFGFTEMTIEPPVDGHSNLRERH